jgi:hypothetical protein
MAHSYDTDYIGCFSAMSANGGASLIVDDAWDNSSTGSTWSSIYWAYDAQGNLLNPDGVLAWTGLAQNHWYSETTGSPRGERLPVRRLGGSNGMPIDNVNLDPVPEPATLSLTGIGFVALIALRRHETTS